jgi:small conductance mechanosensitive channel
VLFVKVVFPEGSILNYIINGNLDRSLNLFVVSRSAMILIVVLFGAKIAQRVINVLSSNLGARAETIGNLLESVIEYGGVIGVIFYALHLMGLNTASLLTSAGILSIVVGLGAQSLISDILAGIFIVFEGEFRVGDIVTVGDFRGTVLEIGIRTTKIEDFLGNIKIYNNSSISGVLNMTKEYSTVPITLAIEYGESLERVEAVLNEEFPRIKEKLTNIVSGPFYKGVSSLGDNSVNLLVIAQCLEADRIQVTRDLNREIYLAFNRHNINVPFPQVTVSYLKDEKTKTTRKDKKNAETFVEEQKEASVGVDTFKP